MNATMIPLIAGLVLGLVVVVGYVVVLVGMRQEDRRMRLGTAPPSRAAALARRVTGCHVRRGRRPSSAP